MFRGLREFLSSIPREDFGIAAFYLLLGGGLQLAGLRGIGVVGLDLFPELTLWPVLLLIACCAIALRSTRTAVMVSLSLVAAVLLALNDAGIIALLLVFEVIFSGTLYAGRALSRSIQVFAIGLSVGSVAAAALAGNGWQLPLAAGLQSVVAFLTPMWWASNVRQQQQIAAAEQERARQAELVVQQERELARLDLELSVTRERGKMARDLHDVIAGRLSAIALQSEAALRSEDPALRTEVLQASRRTSLKALADMRQMIEVLYTGEEALDDPGSAGGLDLDSELRALAVTSRISGNPVNLDAHIPQGLSAATASTLYRISQEALTNAAKHAPGQAVVLRLASEAEGLLLTVENPIPQPAIASEDRFGYGLQNMAVRTEELGGSFSAGAQDGNWLLVARLPR